MSKAKKTIILIIPLVIFIGVVGIYFLFPGVAFTLFNKIERSKAGLEQRSIEVEGLHIEYLEGGKGDVLLLLHGFGANKENWLLISPYLTPHFRVIAPDLPGFGESTRDPEAEYSISAQVDRIHAFVRALKLKRFHIGGNSMGGEIAGVYAARYSKEVNSLWLLAPGGIASAEPSELGQVLIKQGKNPLLVKSPEDYDQLLDYVFHTSPFIPTAIKHHLAQEAMNNRPLNNKIFDTFLKARALPPLEVVLDDLPIPTLILWGDKDRILHVSGAGILESVMPKAKTAIMKNVGHAPMAEKPKESAKLFLSFVGITNPPIK